MAESRIEPSAPDPAGPGPPDEDTRRGAEFNAELERGRAIAAGTPPDAEPFVEMRDTRKLHRHRRAGRAAS